MPYEQIKGDLAVAQVLVLFHTIVVRDGIDPQRAHTAFLNIKEYAENIAGDIEGSTNTNHGW